MCKIVIYLKQVVVTWLECSRKRTEKLIPLDQVAKHKNKMVYMPGRAHTLLLNQYH